MVDTSRKSGIGKPLILPTVYPGRLLVIDDCRYDLGFVSKGMSARGHHVAAVESGEAGLKLLEDEEFDLVLLDGRLPTYDGLELLRLIRAKKSKLTLPIIMTTGLDQPDAVVEALHAGANDYVTKPLDLNIVSARVDTQLSILRLLRQQEEFLAFATHDLRTPLSVILGYTSVFTMWKNSGKLEMEDVVALINSLQKSASFMSEIVNDFVDFHALQAGSIKLKEEEVDVVELLDFVASSTSDLAEKKAISLQVEELDEPISITCDRTRIAQVLQNFVGNAIKFCGDGCTILVRAIPNEHSIRVEVVDDGPGILDDEMKDLFKKFARLAARPTGGEKSSGLGLSICKQLVELHGGSIGADNNAGRGATFWFCLPRTRDQDAQDPKCRGP